MERERAGFPIQSEAGVYGTLNGSDSSLYRLG